MMRYCLIVVGLAATWALGGARGDWPEPRGDGTLTAVQEMAGAMKGAPTLVASYDLGRAAPAPTAVDGGRASVAVVAGALYCFEPDGRARWVCRERGVEFTHLVACADLDGDGSQELVMEAGRPADPYAAVVAVSLADGRMAWRADVEPMSYSWHAYVDHYLPKVKGSQVLVVMQGYPPDAAFGYCALYEFPSIDKPSRRWRYPFSDYTCFPTVLTSDVDGDGIKEICVETHSRMWVLDATSGAVKQFIKWDVSPANVRSYGLTEFRDLDGDGRDDFLCLANFSKHYEVLLNRDGKLVEAWHQGWADSVTTAHVAVCWPEVPVADLDGDGRPELVVSVYENGGWRVRVHDPVSGAVKAEYPGVVAAAVRDFDGDGAAEVLGDVTSSPTRSRPDGGYEVERTDGAVVLKMKGGKLEPVWRDAGARAVRGAGLVVTKGGKRFAVAGGKLTEMRPEPAPKALPAPAVVGAVPQQVLAADVLGRGRNQVILCAKPAVSVLELERRTLKLAATLRSECVPAIADVDGDGATDVVAIRDGRVVAENLGSGKTLWSVPVPAGPSATPWPGLLYLRAGRFLGRPAGRDLFLMTGEPRVGAALLDGRDGRVVWVKGESDKVERYFGPTHNHAAAVDLEHDGVDELVFTSPDYLNVVDARTGNLRYGPTSPQTIFSQPNQGLYTFPAILGDTICLVGGHYFQGALTTVGRPLWYRTPAIGRARCSNEAFVRSKDGAWRMAFVRQDGVMECVDVASGVTRWTHDLHSGAADPSACDVDGDGRLDVLVTTHDGRVLAVTDDGDRARVVWQLDVPPGSGGAIPADVNGDGRADVIVPGGDGVVRVYASP